MEERLILKTAVARYGLSVYPLPGFPREYHWDKIWTQLLSYFGGDPRLGDINVTIQPPIPELGMTDAELVVHFPDWSVEIRYVRRKLH